MTFSKLVLFSQQLMLLPIAGVRVCGAFSPCFSPCVSLATFGWFSMLPLSLWDFLLGAFTRLF